MADIDNNTDLVAQVTSHAEMNDNNVEVSDISENLVDHVSVDVTDEDMLQNALVEASDTFPGEVQMQYADESEVLATGDLINNDVQFITDPSNIQDSNNHLPETFTANGAGVTFINDSNFVAQVNKDESDGINSVYTESNDQSGTLVEQSTSQLINSQFIQSVANSQPQLIVQQQVQQGPAPLGSSSNPIRIIQQGNQYTPVQQLSGDQMQQIMQVVQQQQVGKTISAGSSVLFNPQTNTRIVYRVIYPSQLHKDEAGGVKVTDEPRLVSNTPRRTYKKRIKEEDMEKVDGPELTREEKEQRKKMCPKTRSGRVSKPPKHMVKDFKHIHVLDYDEDYDDSDGGYSDFKYSDGEEELEKKEEDDNYVANTSVTDSTKPKKWKCITCEKAYIGRAGLARHLKLNPSHGSLDIEGEGDMEPPDPSVTPTSVDYGIPASSATPNGFNNTASSTHSFSEDSRDSSVSLTYTPTPRPRGSRSRGRGMRGMRGRGAYKVDPETRRRNKLKEIMRECSDEELMEIVLPRLAKVITLWEFLLMKVEKGDPAWPHADDIYQEYEKLHQHVKKLCQEYLEYVIEPDHSAGHQSLLKVEDTNIANALGLRTGVHRVRDIADTDSDLQYKYKFLTTNQTVDFDYTNKSFLKRTVEVVSPEQIVSPTKKMKTLPKCSIISSVAPVQRNFRTSDAITVASSVGGSNTNRAPFVSKIKILTPGKMNGNIGAANPCSNSAGSGKSVSLLSTSLTKQSQSSSSLSSLSSSSTLTSLPSPVEKSNHPSHKLIMVSGMDTVSGTSGMDVMSGTSPLSSLVMSSSQQVRTSAINPSIEPQSLIQSISSSGQTLNSQSRIVLHDSVTGTYTVCSLMDNLTNISQANELPPNSTTSQQVGLSLPHTTNSQFMQPKFVLNDMNVLNSVPTDTSEFPQVISTVTGEDITGRQIVSVKSDESFSTGVSESDIGIMNSPADSLVLLPGGEPVRIAGTSTNDTGNVIYALTNGDAAQENVVLTVDPNSMFVTQMDDKSDTEMSAQDIPISKPEEPSIGVINSIDTSLNKPDKHSTDKDQNWQVVNPVISNGDTPEFINTSQINGNYGDTGESKFISTLSEDQTPVAAIGDDVSDKVNNVGPKSNNQIENVNETVNQEETIQIPATSIFQTEDGLIFIQNPDGSTLQLQGPDGQAASMETVQALLGMDLETSQIVTEENGT